MKFKLETEFQETEIGKIPREWRIKKLGELALETYYGLTAKAVNQLTGLRMLRTTDIKDNYRVDWDSLPYCEITDNRRSNIQKYLLRKNDLVVSRAGTTGMSILVDKDFNDVIFGSYLIKIKLNESVAYPKFIHYFMQSSLYWNQLLPKQAGSTLKNISLPILKNILTPLPSINEQKLIPEILSTIDRAIEVVDAGVARLEGLKKAVMRELLTGRIRVREENGKLVFNSETEFQDTEIGEIPKDWKIEKLKDIVIKAKMGGTPRSTVREYWGGDIPFAKVEDITSSNKYLFKTSITITKIGLENSNAWIIPKDSLLITIYGTLGAVAINKIELATNQAIVGIIPRKDIVDVEYLYYWYSFFQPNWNKYVKKSTQPNLTLEIVTNSKLPLPSINEQQRIAEILSTVDRTIELYREERIRLDRLKRGLMDLLLTGKIRVVED